MAAAKRTMHVLVIMLMALAAFSCRRDRAGQKSSKLAEIRQRGYMTIATSPDYPPFEFVDDNGDVAGIEIEIIAKVAEDMNLKLRYQVVDFKNVMKDVTDGKYDLGVSGFTITEKRAESALFSTPHSLGGLRIIAPESSSIRGLEGLNGATVAVQAGSTAQEYCESRGYSFVACKSNEDALGLVRSGEADAWVADNLIAGVLTSAWNSASEEKLITLDDLLTREEYAFLASKDNEDLIIEVNKSLRRLRDDGTIGRIFMKYGTAYSQAKDYIL